MQIGFIGLGNKAAAVAANLVRARHDVAIWNRTADKAQPLVDAGATLAESPRAAAADRDVVFTMLADDVFTMLADDAALDVRSQQSPPRWRANTLREAAGPVARSRTIDGHRESD